MGFTDSSLPSLPEDPVRNLDLDAHGRKTAAEAWVVTVAIFPDLIEFRGRDVVCMTRVRWGLDECFVHAFVFHLSAGYVVLVGLGDFWELDG